MRALTPNRLHQASINWIERAETNYCGESKAKSSTVRRALRGRWLEFFEEIERHDLHLYLTPTKTQFVLTKKSPNPEIEITAINYFFYI